MNRDLTLAGTIVVAPAEFEHASSQLSRPAEQKAALGALRFVKINLADRVVVVNPGGYIGESTRRAIHYAHQTGRPVEYTNESNSDINP